MGNSNPCCFLFRFFFCTYFSVFERKTNTMGNITSTRTFYTLFDFLFTAAAIADRISSHHLWHIQLQARIHNWTACKYIYSIRQWLVHFSISIRGSEMLYVWAVVLLQFVEWSLQLIRTSSAIDVYLFAEHTSNRSPFGERFDLWLLTRFFPLSVSHRSSCASSESEIQHSIWEIY